MYGLTYVVTHSGFRSVKVGCTTERAGRLLYLARHGWLLHEQLRLQSKGMAQMIEQRVLFQLRHRLGFPAHLNHELMGHGWSETVSASLIEAAGVWDLVCEEAADVQMASVIGEFRPVRRRPPIGYRRCKGDTPRYVAVARRLAASTARDAQMNAPGQLPPKKRAEER